MSTSSRILATSLVTGIVATSLLLATAAIAQTSAPSSSPSTSAPAPTVPGTRSQASIPDKKLDAAAAAAKKVVVLNRDYKAKLEQAPTAQKEQLTNEANDAMTKAVTDQGLSVQEYLSIMQVAQNDPAVRDKLVERMK